MSRRRELSQAAARLPRAAYLLATTVAMTVCLLRVWNIHRHFWMLGDQIRDWSIALRPFRDLPLVGPATHVGGYTIGPAFYWILWALRVTVGPLFDNLPHAGGIGQAALQSAVDALLLVAIWRRFGSVWLALAVIVLVTTGAYDLCLSPLVWNPVMGSTLAKAAVALLLLDWHRRSAWHTGAMVALAWGAVHAYTGAIFVTVSILGVVLVDPLLRSDRPVLRRNVALVVVIVGLLQVPYVVHQFRVHLAAPAMGAVTGSVAEVMSGRRPPDIEKSVAGYVGAIEYIQASPWRIPGFGWLLAAGGIVVAIRWFRDVAVLGVTLAPALLAIAGYSLFLAELDNYYYLSLVTCAVLQVALAVTAIPVRPLAQAIGVALLVISLVLVPARVRLAATLHKMPEYEALVKASRTLAQRGQPVRAIRTEFPLLPTVDPTFPYRILGGAIDRTSPWTAIIRRDGMVRYRSERR